MVLTRPEIDTAATDLFEAERSGVQTGLLSIRHPQMTMDDAYAVQAALVEKKLAAGARKVGWKIGLTSRAMQDALGIETPDSGVLLDDMVFQNGTTVPRGRFIQPRIEAEIAFVMKDDLAGPDVGVNQVIAATDHVVAALEILDTRILRADPETGKSRIIVDTISDNAANAGIVTADETFAADAHDLRWIGAIVSRDGEVEETGLGAGVLNNPALAIAWLANRLADYGESIRAGEVLLSGSFIRPIEAPGGSTITADFGPMGVVECSFE